MSLLTWVLIGTAALVVASNLLFVAASLACYRLRERRWPDRLPIGIPLLSMLLLGAAWLQSAEGLPGAAYALVPLDAGGPLGWLCAWGWRRAHARRPLRAAPRAASWVAPPQNG
ncbi:MAG: hypothetical protein KDJ14_05140 [Xanthomonadales bacterium]|nr:hypothetical protein [Xanthomonadales bacterium]